MPKKTAKTVSGWSRIKAQGLTAVQLTPNGEEIEKIRQAAALDGRSVAQFLLRAGVAAAEKILGKSGN